MSREKDDLWGEGYKIPWNEPGFSRRMLREHLSEDHDLASRRGVWIDRQTAWIHQHLLGARPSRILDLGCGPGLYGQRLTQLGHDYRGFDFGPASIEFARQHNVDEARCEFILGDIRHVDFAGPYELAMILFGEFNVFSPDEAAAILNKAWRSLESQGRLIVELQTASAVEAVGRGESTEQEFESGLFSDHPHRCRTENQWLSDQRVSVQTFHVTEAGNGPARVYRNTTKAWSDDELAGLLVRAGFAAPSRCDAWPSNTDTLSLWIASKR